jgi:hypothetical protein
VDDDLLKDIKRMLVGIQGTILGLTLGLLGKFGNTDVAEFTLLLGIIIFIISLLITATALRT